MQGYDVNLGMAHLGAVCLPHINCAINSFLWDTLGPVSLTIVHELGNNLGMPHHKKSCVCGQKACMMFRERTLPPKFNNCSYTKMWDHIYQRTCLHNIPNTKPFRLPALCWRRRTARLWIDWIMSKILMLYIWCQTCYWALLKKLQVQTTTYLMQRKEQWMWPSRVV